MEYLPSDGPYPLSAEADMLTGMVALAAARYARHGQTRQVNAVELGYWVEGARLGVWFVSQQGHQYPDGPWKAGYSDRNGRAVFCQFFAVPPWHLLHRPARGCRVTDSVGAVVPEPDDISSGGIGWSHELVEVVGRNLADVVAERHGEMFAGLGVTDPLRVVVFEDEDSDLAWLVRIVGGTADITRGASDPAF